MASPQRQTRRTAGLFTFCGGKVSSEVLKDRQRRGTPIIRRQPCSSAAFQLMESWPTGELK